MLALTVIVPERGIGPDQLALLRNAIAEHAGDVPLVVHIGRRRLLLGATFAVDPSLELEARLRDLGLDLGRDREVSGWRA